MTIQEFLDTEAGRRYCKAEWARRLQVTRGYFSQLSQGSKTPSLPLAVFIEEISDGKVKCSDWNTAWPPNGKHAHVNSPE